MLAAAACGGTQSTPPPMYNGTFAVTGAPNSGTYTECTVSASGPIVTLSCDGLDSGCAVGDCAAVISFGNAAGDYQCSLGDAAVTLFDPSLPDTGGGQHPANAGCQSSMVAMGQPLSDCPKDMNGCNRALGDCAISAGTVTPIDTVTAPFGHFSGTITATVWTSSKTVNDCGSNMDPQLYPDGQKLDLTFTGGW